MAYLYTEKHITDEIFFVDSDKSPDISDVNLENAHCLFVKNSELTFDEYSFFKNEIDSIIYDKDNNLIENDIVNINVLTTMCGNFGASNVFIVGNLFRDYLEKVGANYSVCFLFIPMLSIGAPCESKNDYFNKRINKFITSYQDSSFSQLRRNHRVKLYVPLINHNHLFFHENNDFKYEISKTFLKINYVITLLSMNSFSDHILTGDSIAGIEDGCYINEIITIDKWIREVYNAKINENKPKFVNESNNVNNLNGYAFISYSSKNQNMADSTRELFKQKGINFWMAPYDIPPGSKYAFVINDALENCSCLVLLLTEESQNSEFVEKEVERAITYRKPIITMQLEDIELNSGFKFYIGNQQIVAVKEINSDNDAMRRVLNGVTAFVGVDKSINDNESNNELNQAIEKFELTSVETIGVDDDLDNLLNSFMNDFDKVCLEAEEKRLNRWINNGLMKE